MGAPKRLIHGFGRNDAVESTAEGTRLRPYYNKWRDMLGRCYDGRYKAYEGISVCEEWHSFSAFYEWMILQPWKGNELDKDIIVPGNTVYSPETCVFVPRKINLQFRRVRTGARASGLPAGVYLYPYDGKVVKYKVNGDGHLGYVRDPMEGHKLWQLHKIKTLNGLIGLSDDSRVNSRISEVISRIEFDLAKGLETEWK